MKSPLLLVPTFLTIGCVFAVADHSAPSASIPQAQRESELRGIHQDIRKLTEKLEGLDASPRPLVPHGIALQSAKAAKNADSQRRA